MKRKEKKARFLAPRPGFYLYLVLLPFSLVFTQLLRSPASAILFIFLVILFPLSILYLILARAMIKIYTDVDRTRTKKGESVEYEIKIINESPLPFPLVETVVTLPSDDAYSCSDKLLRISLLPLGCHIIRRTVNFPLRGSYDIGVRSLRVYDFVGFFATEVRLELGRTVIVYPDNIAMSENTRRSDTDLPTPVTRPFATSDQAEPADIREYTPGDPIKNIHWKLSAKSDDLQVKNFASNMDRSVYILCDLSFSDTQSPDKSDSARLRAKEKSRDTRSKKKRRRERVEHSAAVASARAVGEAGAHSPKVSSGPREADERLEALGITPADVAAIGSFEADEVATRGGARAARRVASERMAELAIKVSRNADAASEVKERPVYDPDALAHAGEICSDAVIELALSLMRKETLGGCNVTLVYPDSRNENGIGVLTSGGDIPESPELLELYTAPVCDSVRKLSHLAAAIDGSSNVTLRIVTANTDTESAAVASSIPAMFGGAGSGCSAEVLIASPEKLYASPEAASAQITGIGTELSRSGIRARTFTREVSPDGSLRYNEAF